RKLDQLNPLAFHFVPDGQRAPLELHVIPVQPRQFLAARAGQLEPLQVCGLRGVRQRPHRVEPKGELLALQAVIPRAELGHLPANVSSQHPARISETGILGPALSPPEAGAKEAKGASSIRRPRFALGVEPVFQAAAGQFLEAQIP
ncbi:hypothetical protein, partial [Thioalkalivibrio versutus]|uniref:hypothetical protein n=1 Tax=Thioalkalivibrio versutus TaxID=106634 RepID=UPI001E5B05A1